MRARTGEQPPRGGSGRRWEPHKARAHGAAPLLPETTPIGRSSGQGQTRGERAGGFFSRSPEGQSNLQDRRVDGRTCREPAGLGGAERGTALLRVQAAWVLGAFLKLDLVEGKVRQNPGS